ncbi:MAG: dethiobiotin synthase [Pseudonocardia sp.]|nr:dethiobiotin synthase [Pseudonocardia sp.]
MTVLVVTGTDTGVGKTITTAALAVALTARGHSVAVYKPVQAGTDEGDGDIDVVRRLAGITAVAEGVRLRDPMAPVAAAARSGARLPPLPVHRDTIARLAADHDHVLVEGAGGLLVALDADGHTIADLALAPAPAAAAIVVCRSGLGTLNHTALTLEALAARGIAVAGLVVGSWPRRPTEIERDNLRWLCALAVPLLGTVPDGAGQLAGDRFRQAAPHWFGPDGPRLSRIRSPWDPRRPAGAGSR